MRRMIDQLREPAARVQMPFCVRPRFQPQWERHALTLHQLLADPSLPVIQVDNVAEYYYSGSGQEFWNLAKDFPNLAPPFPMFWVEHRMIQKIHSHECGDTDVSALVGKKGHVGALLLGAERDQVSGEGIPESAHWVMAAELFIDYDRGGPIQGPHGTILLAIDSEGTLLDRPSIQCFLERDDPMEETIKALVAYLHPALLAISFLHCHNVKVTEERVAKPLAKRQFAKHGVWPAPYKTLEIRPLKEILRREGGSDQHGLAKAMHICRGHFRDYRQGKGLFGKIHKLVWSPATVRGTRRHADEPAAPPREIEVKL